MATTDWRRDGGYVSTTDDLDADCWVTSEGGVRVYRGPVNRVRPPAVCGTEGGYYRHLRITKTPTCAACRLAHNHAENLRRQARREAS